MGLPQIDISFAQLGKTASDRSARGIVALVLKDTTHSIFTVQEEGDIPEGLKASNKKLLKLAIKGNRNAPNKVLVYALASDGNIDDALNYFESQEFTLFCMPEASTEKTKIKAFLNKMNAVVRYKVDGLMFGEVANKEEIINVTATGVEFDGEVASNADVLARIAGMLEGTPLHEAVTYAVLPDATKVENITKEQADSRIDAGELILVREMGKIRIARGVNSLTDNSKGDAFKKIKLRKIMNLIHNDIRRVLVDRYIGKVPNSYDNKCLLITEINNYLAELAKEQLIQADYSVGIDLEAHRKYLIDNTNLDVANMTEQEIKEANTKSFVFLAIKVKLLDSIEDVDVKIAI